LLQAVRAPSAIFGVATLLWGFAQAPFFHIHAEDLDHEENSGLQHVHFPGFPLGPGPHIAPYTADDDAVDVLWSISAPPSIDFHLDLDAAERSVLEAPVLARSAPPAISLHSHDPPSLRPGHPRAPPA